MGTLIGRGRRILGPIDRHRRDSRGRFTALAAAALRHGTWRAGRGTEKSQK
jgi:hypothetical protein